MKYLIIDTSTNTASIGLAEDGKIIASHSWYSKQNLSETLLVEIDKLLLSVIPRDRGISRSFLRQDDYGFGGVIAYLGPGSYTGLRIGITVANTFAYALGIPIAGIKNENYQGEKFDTATLEKQDLKELLKKGLEELPKKKAGEYLIPFYGKEPNVG